MYLMLCSIPSLLAAFLIGFLDESPIFLINAGRHEEAMDILISIAANSPYSKVSTPLFSKYCNNSK